MLTDNGGGWGLVASPVFKTGVTRLSRAWWVRFPHSPAILFAFAVVFTLAWPSRAVAQRADSVKTGVKPPKRSVASSDSLGFLPVSPKKAFFTSLAFPGSMQIKFGRPKAAAIFLVAEAGTVAMSAKSWHDLDVAKTARADTVVTLTVDNLGKPVIDPETGKQKFTSAPRNPNIADRVVARRTHLEDWIAGVVFTHLFAGADAFVAANLQDFNTNVNVTSTGRGVKVLASIAW